MSIFNDKRRFSDDPDEHLEWKAEVERECRRDDYEQDDDMVIDLDEEEGAE